MTLVRVSARVSQVPSVGPRWRQVSEQADATSQHGEPGVPLQRGWSGGVGGIGGIGGRVRRGAFVPEGAERVPEDPKGGAVVRLEIPARLEQGVALQGAAGRPGVAPLVARDGGQHRRVGQAGPGRAPVLERLHGRDCKAPDVRGRAVLEVGDGFGGRPLDREHAVRGAVVVAGARAGLADRAAQAKVGDLADVARGQEDVAGGEIAVDNAAPHEVQHPARNLVAHVQLAALAERLAVRLLPRERVHQAAVLAVRHHNAPGVAACDDADEADQVLVLPDRGHDGCLLKQVLARRQQALPRGHGTSCAVRGVAAGMAVLQDRVAAGVAVGNLRRYEVFGDGWSPVFEQPLPDLPERTLAQPVDHRQPRALEFPRLGRQRGLKLLRVQPPGLELALKLCREIDRRLARATLKHASNGRRFSFVRLL